ncbi:glycosyl hydrolase 43 family protein [Prevotella sp. PINT]|jgi:Beta-xylosidase|uniref:glycoside hydrolase family 43 protein n=1 Tax=Palleniella intestinalis TaxID=2736291 RepID=UPI001556371A|nr:glycoside hydrolase 43 family protein [Palleniella intestinalis]NPD81732.1 glycosyl hydrolase 43 family protein [Palleniella intestinalis]
MKQILAVGLASLLLSSTNCLAQSKSNTWNPNLPGNKYKNPIIDADYSDPDVCRVGNDYYMTSSSFACFPGLQILHSTDLVNWEIIGAALTDDYPVLPENKGKELDWRKKIQHGNYVWAPAIRYHDGWFYIYCGDPDQGLFMTKTQDPRGTWTKPVWVKEGKGMIDCCPLWDDDGKAYLSHGCAGSRAGVKSVLFVAPMSPDGEKVIGPSRIVYDGHEDQPTIEGTKFYKRNGYYYIFSPAGGVKYGWQVELRSKNPFGPYEEYVGLAQGKSKVNGPHQGAWVDTQNGEDWFLHFQDKHAYGRVVHLQPAKWVNDWLVIGDDKDGDGCGDAVATWKKPNLPASKNPVQPAEDDDFNSPELGKQWQFEGPYSHYWYFCDANKSKLRLYGVEQPEEFHNLSDLQNALLQKFPTENFTATAKVKFIPNPSYKNKGEQAGFIIKGQDYAALRFITEKGGKDGKETICKLQYVVCEGAQKGKAEKVIAEQPVDLKALPAPYTQKYAVDDIPQPRNATPDVYVRCTVKSSGTGNSIKSHAQFSYSLDGKKFKNMGTPFAVKEGKWIGAKVGFYNSRPTKNNDGAFLDVDWIKFTK